VIDGSNVVLSDREMMAMLLDLRTLPCNNVETDVRKEAVRLLKLAYVEFGVNCVLYDRRIEAAAKLAASTNARKSNADVLQPEGARLRLKAAHGTVLDASETAFDPLGTWSDDEVLDDGENVGGCEVDVSTDVLWQQLSVEFDIKFRAWRNHPAKINWSKVDSNVVIRDPLAPDMLELMGMNVSSLYQGLDEGGSQFGHLPAMASCAKGQIGALNAESFCERCLSCANLIVTDGNTILLDEEVMMLVVLRMNVDFMEFMRDHYAHLIVKQPWKMTIVE
jgi:hypothetical protein